MPEEQPLTPYEVELLKAAADHDGELFLDKAHHSRPYHCIAYKEANDLKGFGGDDRETAAHYTGALNNLQVRGLVEYGRGIVYRLTSDGWTTARDQRP